MLDRHAIDLMIASIELTADQRAESPLLAIDALTADQTWRADTNMNATQWLTAIQIMRRACKYMPATVVLTAAHNNGRACIGVKAASALTAPED